MVSESVRAEGERILRDLIGDEFLERRRAGTNDFNRDIWAMAEAYCFGEIWSRPGLDRKTRSMLCIAMLTALGKPNELKLHVAGAIRNGCTADEIKEVLLQTMIYCGLPACSDAVRVADEALREINVD